METDLTLKKYIGLTLEEAKLLALQNEDIIRVRIKDNENYFGTMDYVENRVNLNIQKGLVIEAWVG